MGKPISPSRTNSRKEPVTIFVHFFTDHCHNEDRVQGQNSVDIRNRKTEQPHWVRADSGKPDWVWVASSTGQSGEHNPARYPDSSL